MRKRSLYSELGEDWEGFSIVVPTKKELPPKTGEYGYIELEYRGDIYDEVDAEPEIRKVTASEREEIILNFIRTHSGKKFILDKMAESLGVCIRTIQKTLRVLEGKNLITRIPQKGRNGRQTANAYVYNGEKGPLPPNALTLSKLYHPDNPAGFRDWHWDKYKFIPGVYDENFTKYDAQVQSEELKWRKSVLIAKRDALKEKAKKNNKN